MKKILTTWMITCIMVLLCQAQQSNKKSVEKNQVNEFKAQDFSSLWYNAPNQSQNVQSVLPEYIGFIGNNYQRFYIHFLSISKNPKKPLEYWVTGKSKVKNIICNFKGTITLTNVSIQKEADWPDVQLGKAIAEIRLNEDSSQQHSGYFKGKMVTYFYVDKYNQIHYDDLTIGGDGYNNNQCVTTWTDYKSKQTKPVHWGIERIPQCGDLDIGAGEFSVNDKYVKNGWQNYRDLLSTDAATSEKAFKQEQIPWWHEN